MLTVCVLLTNSQLFVTLAHPEVLPCTETKGSVLPETSSLTIKRSAQATAGHSIEPSLCACYRWWEETPRHLSALTLWWGTARADTTLLLTEKPVCLLMHSEMSAARLQFASEQLWVHRAKPLPRLMASSLTRPRPFLSWQPLGISSPSLSRTALAMIVYNHRWTDCPLPQWILSQGFKWTLTFKVFLSHRGQQLTAGNTESDQTRLGLAC